MRMWLIISAIILGGFSGSPAKAEVDAFEMASAF